jgi:hypothetical protein
MNKCLSLAYLTTRYRLPKAASETRGLSVRNAPLDEMNQSLIFVHVRS